MARLMFRHSIVILITVCHSRTKLERITELMGKLSPIINYNHYLEEIIHVYI
jgi:hypothetical protein